MLEWNRKYLLERVENRPLEDIRHEGVLPNRDASKQAEVLNHFLTELYVFLDSEQFAVEEKAIVLNLCGRVFVESFQGKLNAEQSKELLQSRLEPISSILPESPSPALRLSHRDKLLKYLDVALYSLYKFYAVAYVEYIDYNLAPWQPPNTQQQPHNKLVAGKVVADPSKVPCLMEFVSELKPIAEEPAKAKKK